MARRVSTDVDVVVIGSGAGGLTAATALARAGQSVAVFEQHYLPGGWCHSFSLGGHRFSPGVHYVGELGPGKMLRRIYEGLGLGDDLAFYELAPDGFDHVLVGDERFDIPAGRLRFEAALTRRFPSERTGIARYLDTIEALGRELGDVFSAEGTLDLVRAAAGAPHLLRWGLRSAQSLIDGHVRDPFLRAILAAQCGDHGLPPSLAPAPLHAAVTSHYIDGGFYPRGGAGAIPRAFIRSMSRAGAEIHVRTPVAKILVEGGRAIGVELEDGRTIRARVVISNADPTITFGRLLDPAHVSARTRRKLRQTRYSVSALSLFLAVDTDLRAAGMDSGNYWCFRDADLEGAYQHGRTGWGHETTELRSLFFTSTSLKDPGRHRRGEPHVIEAFTFVGHDAFRQWASTRFGERPGSYVALKSELTARMIDAIAQRVPAIRERVTFADLGTPLTNEHYCAATGGSLYGTEKTLWQLGPGGYGLRTEIDDLYLCGASTLSHGVLGATVSGLGVAREILGVTQDELLANGQPVIKLLAAERRDVWAMRAAAEGPRTLERHAP
jgi:phytoene dehydrogenase-like protein